MDQIVRWIIRQIYKIPSYDSRQDNNMYGKFYVRYRDGRRSEPMCWDSAKTYAEIFKGRIEDNFHIIPSKFLVDGIGALVIFWWFIVMIYGIGILQGVVGSVRFWSAIITISKGLGAGTLMICASYIAVTIRINK